MYFNYTCSSLFEIIYIFIYTIYYNIIYNRSTHFSFCSENIFQEGVKVKIIDTQNYVDGVFNIIYVLCVVFGATIFENAHET